MKEKADAIIKGHMKPKLSFYVSTLYIKITVLIILFVLILAMDTIFE